MYQIIDINSTTICTTYAVANEVTSTVTMKTYNTRYKLNNKSPNSLLSCLALPCLALLPVNCFALFLFFEFSCQLNQISLSLF